MDHIDEKLNSLLNDPNAMRMIMDFAKQLSGEDSAAASAKEEPNPFQNFDPAMLTKLMPLLQEFRKGESSAAKLLYALQPYLSEKKQDKVNQAVKMAHLIHVGKKFFLEGGWDLV